MVNPNTFCKSRKTRFPLDCQAQNYFYDKYPLTNKRGKIKQKKKLHFILIFTEHYVISNRPSC